jgi:hypothetical protein
MESSAIFKQTELEDVKVTQDTTKNKQVWMNLVAAVLPVQ